VKVAVLGAAGGIGQPLSLLMKSQLPPGSTLALYDVINVIGVGADISHVPTAVKLEVHLGDLKNPENVEELTKALKGADVVIIPAGVPRKPGMTRDDLFKVNAGIVRTLIVNCAKTCPSAFIGIITNPVNSTIPVAAEILKKHGVYDPRRLFGVSTLDVTRAQTFIGELKGLDPQKVDVKVVGGHSAETMVPLLSQVPGVTFTDQEVKDLTLKIADAGTVVVNAKEGNGSATLSMAYAGARFVLNLVRALQGEKGVVECAYVNHNFSIEEHQVPYFGFPVELGPDGGKILPIGNFSGAEVARLKEVIPALQKNIQTGVEFANQ